MITYLAEVCAVPQTTVTKVIDGFWEYVGDASKHRIHWRWVSDPSKQRGHCRYFGTPSKHRVEHLGTYLVIPHFGTFRRVATESRGVTKQRLRFRSLSPDQLRDRLARSPGHSLVWVRQYLRAPDKAGRLSVRRRIAVHIATQKDLRLDETYGLLCAMLDLCAHAIQHGDHTIGWYGRGSMHRVGHGRDANRYRFTQYRSVEFNGVHL